MMATSRLFLCIMLACLACASLAYPETTGTSADTSLAVVSVDEMVFCAGVKNRSPVAVSDTFPSDVFSVYCFTTVVGATDSTAVIHSWYYKDRKLGSVELPVKSARWRTWSSKKMWSELKGEWRVEVTTPDGAAVRSKTFQLK